MACNKLVCNKLACKKFKICIITDGSKNTPVNVENLIGCLSSFSVVKKKTQVKITPNPAIRWLWYIQIQKEVISNPKQPSCNKRYGPQKGHGEKRCEIQGGNQEMAVMVG